MAHVGRRALFILVLVLAGCDRPAALPAPGAALAVGERLYREGRLASGQPASALVGGDVPMVGAQAACVSCHQRSGMGSSEGWLVAPPVTEAALYAPVRGRRRNRPGYTDKTLARALREGVDPAGQLLDRAMPRYDLPADELKALIAYLRTLSAAPSPGVTQESIHFATVTTDGADAAAMLAVLTRYFEEKNRGTRNEGRRAESGPFYLQNVNRAYRKWVLHPWRLEGPPETWGEQLDARYRAKPVFALISGMSGGTWQPVHEFCQRHAIPCVLPNTDLPVVADGDYYTLYFSQGLTLEARTIAAHLREGDTATAIVQMFRDDTAGTTAATALRKVLADRAGLSVTDVAIRGDTGLNASTAARALGEGTAAIVAWLSPADVIALAPLLPPGNDGPKVYLSSTLLRGEVSAIPVAVRRRSLLAHSFALPSDFRQRFRRVEAWLRQRGIPVTDERIVAQTHFACRVLAEGMMHITQDYFYRDYFLEFVDHLDATARFSIAHPSPSFGPGQRYISKGCYILDLAREDLQAAQDPEWIVP